MLSADIVKKIRRIEICTAHKVNDSLAGEYLSVFKGSGMEFSEVREYTPGDEIRTIDWNVTARAGTPFVKRFIEERDRRVVILADISASGDFGCGTQSKREFATELCAALAFSAIKNNDRVGLLAFSDRIEQTVPLKKGAGQIFRLIRELLALRPVGRGTDLNLALEALPRLTNRRSIVFVVSDFLASGYEKALRVAARRHDVIAVTITDPREKELPRCGLIKVRDLENGGETWVDTESARVREAYALQARARALGLREFFRAQKIDHIELTVGSDYVRELVRFFRMRERRQQAH